MPCSINTMHAPPWCSIIHCQVIRGAACIPSHHKMTASAERSTSARQDERMQRELIDKEAKFGVQRPSSLEVTTDYP